MKYTVEMKKRLLELCRTEKGKTEEIEKLIKMGIPLNEILGKEIGEDYETTYLITAAEEGNIDAVRVLLENGADPNFSTEYENALSELLYTDVDYAVKIDIVELLLRYGANPIDDEDGKEVPLLDWVCFKFFNDLPDTEEEIEYLRRYFLLLIIYGGKTRYCSPVIYRPFDLENTKQYQLYLAETDDGYYYGLIYDDENNLMARV